MKLTCNEILVLSCTVTQSEKLRPGHNSVCQRRLCTAYVARNTKFCGYGVQKHRRCVEDTPELRRGTCGGARQRMQSIHGLGVLQAWSSGAAAGNRRPIPPRAPSVGSQDRSQASQLCLGTDRPLGACPEALDARARRSPQRLGRPGRARWRPQPTPAGVRHLDGRRTTAGGLPSAREQVPSHAHAAWRPYCAADSTSTAARARCLPETPRSTAEEHPAPARSMAWPLPLS